MRAVIDADPIVHIVANVQWSVGNEMNEQLVRDHTNSFVREVLAKCDCDEYIMVVQGEGHKNFRNEILPEYKGHRKVNPAIVKWKPVIISELEKFGVLILQNIESDDALAILAKKYKYEVLVVENDKDLAQIPGRHFNPYKKESPTKPVERWYSFVQFESEYSLAKQTMTGDPTDMPGSLCGIEKVGPKTAEALLGGAFQHDWMGCIAGRYMEKYGVVNGLKRMALTYDMVKLLTNVDEQYPETQVVYDTEFTDYKGSDGLLQSAVESKEQENTDDLFD